MLPTPVFLAFPCGSAGKESACNAGDLGLIPRLGRSPGEGKLPTPVFDPGEFHGLYSTCGEKRWTPLSDLKKKKKNRQFLNNYFNWRITTWQYCDGFCHTST